MPFHTFAFMVASDPNLVVVSVNYRLNVFGFLTTGTKSMPGNLGLKDQVSFFGYENTLTEYWPY